MNSYLGLLKRQCMVELILLRRQQKFLLNALMFFLILMIFLPMILPADGPLLHTVAPGLVWLAVLFMLLLSAERLFAEDYEDGIAEQWLVSGNPTTIFVLAKSIVYWGSHMCIVLALAPLLAILFEFNWHQTLVLILAILSGTPAISLLCKFAAAFGFGLRQKGVFMALVLLPLTLPVLIFGSAASMMVSHNLSWQGHVALLMAISLVAIVLLPLAIAAVVKINFID